MRRLTARGQPRSAVPGTRQRAREQRPAALADGLVSAASASAASAASWPTARERGVEVERRRRRRSRRRRRAVENAHDDRARRRSITTRRMARACGSEPSRAAPRRRRAAPSAQSRGSPAATAAPPAEPRGDAGQVRRCIGVPLRSGAATSHSRATSSCPFRLCARGGMPRRGGPCRRAAAAAPANKKKRCARAVAYVTAARTAGNAMCE